MKKEMYSNRFMLPHIRFGQHPESRDLRQNSLFPGKQSEAHLPPVKRSDSMHKAQGVVEAGALGLDKRPELAQACGALVAYLEQTQKQENYSNRLDEYGTLNMDR